MKNKRVLTVILWILIIGLIAFLIYYFTRKPKGETCPDGRDIPSSGNCNDNPVEKDSLGNEKPPIVAKPDVAGCIQPSSYIENTFPIGLGMRGDKVKQIQFELNIKTNAGLKEDGYFGCKTQAALFNYFGSKSVANNFVFEQQFGSTPLTMPSATT